MQAAVKRNLVMQEAACQATLVQHSVNHLTTRDFGCQTSLDEGHQKFILQENAEGSARHLGYTEDSIKVFFKLHMQHMSEWHLLCLYQQRKLTKNSSCTTMLADAACESMSWSW